jgi:hypothetical protein
MKQGIWKSDWLVGLLLTIVFLLLSMPMFIFSPAVFFLQSENGLMKMHGISGIR